MFDNRNLPYHTHWLLWLIALFSLGLNIAIIAGLLIVRGMIADVLPQANQYLYESLDTLADYDGYEMPIHLVEEITLSNTEEVLFEDVLQVPVNLTVPVNQSVPFKETIIAKINETITVNQTITAPMVINGQQVLIDVPVNLNVPINMSVPVPVDTVVPVSMEITLDEVLEVPVRELIPLRNGQGEPLTIGLDLETSIPVPMDELMNDIQMLPMLQELHNTLNLLEAILFLPLPE